MADDDTSTQAGGDSTDQQRDAAGTDDTSTADAATNGAQETEAEKALRKALNSERQLKSAAEKRLKALEDAGKSELEREREGRLTAEKERDELRTSVLRSKVAAKHDLPAELADRLQGDDEAALEEDAKRLAELVTPVGDMGARRGGAQGTGGSADDMNAQIRRMAGRA